MTLGDPRKFGQVALVVGGDSGEREVSLKGGRAVAAAMDQLGIQYSVVDGPRRLLEHVAAGHYDRVFNLLHGRGGEDGTLQGALSIYGVPVTGSGVLASALTMDKLQSKRIFTACGLPTPEWAVARNAADSERILQSMTPPLFVKPVREGSSLGMSRVMEADQLQPALEKALSHDETVLVEPMIEGIEYTAAVLNDRVLPLIRLETPREFYDYQAKYESGDTQYRCPCGLDEAAEAHLADLCLEAFRVLGTSGWGRVDLMVDEDEQPWLLEVNTTPGMTDHSLMPMAAKAAGIEFEELVWRILETSLSA
ncbi:MULTISPECIES: D-alanine--D-alanine ligase [unclassified Wenzhouxiangella]|uniref:D-alanine--D-alanine ligase n=1 Tax=unclassified Wenzhouxiangella TaxID=2613841 RepID=UPI000E327BA8|nr:MULTISPECIES: D-alanine--D-alanine ligase [unclassified Wenzhouxiangella]RFF28745.1 D-alanine--D-alanine ligase [Wenzhouxiangella sp. 15181]RFP67852.1 D-alanine--D-alanine ligase [Wenzhouxiangella sp. 15190]